MSDAAPVWCFQCGAEYVADVSACVECQVAAVAYTPTPAHLVGSDDEPQLAYDVHEWSFDARSALEHVLHERDLEHGWLGASLIVLEADEAAVDEIIAQVDGDHALELDDDEPQIAYDLEGWDDESRGRLIGLLALDGVPYRVEDDELVVLDADTDRVDAVLDQLEEVAQRAVAFGPGVEGVEGSDVMADLFVSADRLRRGVSDARHAVAFLDSADLATEISLPFGLEPAAWRSILDQVAAVRRAINNEAAEEGEIGREATTLRDQLRAYV